MGVKAKLKKESPTFLNTWLLFVTVSIILVAFLFYNFVYVTNNEEALISRGFRVLSEVGKNIENKIRAIRQVTTNVKQQSKRELESDKVKALRLQSEKDSSTNKDQTLHDKIKKHIANLDIQLKVAPKSIATARNILPIDDYTSMQEEEPQEYVIYMEPDDFFEPLGWADTFFKFIVLEKKTGKEGEHPDVSVIYNPYPGTVDLSGFKPLYDKKTPIDSGNLYHVKSSNENLMLFIKPIAREKNFESSKLYIASLVERSRFVKETRQLASDMVTLILVAFLLLLLCIPLLKIFLMSTFDQLNINDVLLAAVSITLGMLLMVLLFLFYYQKSNDVRCIDENLKALAKRITGQFTEELEKAYTQLKYYDSLTPSDFGLTMKNQVTKVLNDESLKIRFLQYGEKWNELTPKYSLFKVVFWANARGEQKLEISTLRDDASLINVGHRDYFNQAGYWKFAGKDKKRFMLESITSGTSGENLAAISIPSRLELPSTEENELVTRRIPMKVAAMTARLTSVIDTILPAGYGFCIIDKSGDVWFHSDENRNNIENFISETEEDKELLAAISVEKDKSLSLDYQYKKYTCYISPFENMPLFLVTFHDMRYTRSIHIHITIYTMFFTFLLLVFNVLLFAAAAGCGYRESPLKRRYLPFAWLRPVIGKAVVYRCLTATSLLVLCLLLLWWWMSQSAVTPFLCLSAALFVFALNYRCINRVKEEASSSNRNCKYICFFAFLVLIDAAAIYLEVDSLENLLVFQALLFALLWLLPRYIRGSDKPAKPTEQTTSNPEGGASLVNAYAMFILTWLTAVCSVPFVLLYSDAYNHENLIARKHLQLKLAQRIEERDFHIYKHLSEKVEDPARNSRVMDTWRYRKDHGIYTEDVGGIKQVEFAHFRQEEVEDKRFKRLINHLRLGFTQLDLEKQNLVSPREDDDRHIWWQEGGTLYLKYKIKTTIPQSPEMDKPYILAKVKSFPTPGVFGFIIIIFLAALWLSLFYFLLRFNTRMVFGININGICDPPLFPRHLDEAVDSGAPLVVYCQTTRRMESVVKHLVTSAATPFSLEEGLDALGTYGEGVIKKIVVTDFIADLDRPEIVRDYLKIIVQLLRNPSIQLIIPTTIPLTKAIEYFEDIPAEDNDEKKALMEKLNLQLNSVKQTLVPIYIPIKIETVTYREIEKLDNAGAKKFLEKELHPSGYFKGIEKTVCEYVQNITGGAKDAEAFNLEARDRLILKLQELSRHYYSQLLQACTRQEIFVLFDIANDTLINTSNLDTINVLKAKGLLIYDGALHLMNKSFKNFILTTIDSQEAKQMMKELNTRSKWNSYSAPFALILLGLVIFLAFQGSLLNDINALITAVVGALALLSKFSGALTKHLGGGD